MIFVFFIIGLHELDINAATCWYIDSIFLDLIKLSGIASAELLFFFSTLHTFIIFFKRDSWENVSAFNAIESIFLIK